jgi:hypothetical protein
MTCMGLHKCNQSEKIQPIVSMDIYVMHFSVFILYFLKSFLNGQAQCYTPIIQGIQEVEIQKIMVQSQPWQKFNEILISINKLGVVMHACHPSHTGGCW